jgi:hypothetical protein
MSPLSIPAEILVLRNFHVVISASHDVTKAIVVLVWKKVRKDVDVEILRKLLDALRNFSAKSSAIK